MFNFFRRPKLLTFEQIRAETDRLRALIGPPIYARCRPPCAATARPFYA